MLAVAPRSPQPGSRRRLRPGMLHGEIVTITAYAAAVGVAPSAITPRTGARSRTKIFVVEGLPEGHLAIRIQAL